MGPLGGDWLSLSIDIMNEGNNRNPIWALYWKKSQIKYYSNTLRLNHFHLAQLSYTMQCITCIHRLPITRTGNGEKLENEWRF